MTQHVDMLVLGSGGRLGTLLRAAHARDGSRTTEVHFQSRQSGADLLWSPGDPVRALPRCRTLVALWGQTAGDEATLEQNETLVDQTFDIAIACGAKRVLHLSSAGVYGPGTALPETAPTTPLSAYARSKCRMEKRIAAKRLQGNAEHMILRLANVVGADSLAPSLRGSAPVRLDRFANGQGPKRSYIAASDVLRVLIRLSAVPPASAPPILNVAAPLPVDMAALARAAHKDIEWQAAPTAAIQQVTLDVSQMTRLLGPVCLSCAPDALVADWQNLEMAS